MFILGLLSKEVEKRWKSLRDHFNKLMKNPKKEENQTDFDKFVIKELNFLQSCKSNQSQVLETDCEHSKELNIENFESFNFSKSIKNSAISFTDVNKQAQPTINTKKNNFKIINPFMDITNFNVENIDSLIIKQEPQEHNNKSDDKTQRYDFQSSHNVLTDVILIDSSDEDDEPLKNVSKTMENSNQNSTCDRTKQSSQVSKLVFEKTTEENNLTTTEIDPMVDIDDISVSLFQEDLNPGIEINSCDNINSKVPLDGKNVVNVAKNVGDNNYINFLKLKCFDSSEKEKKNSSSDSFRIQNNDLFKKYNIVSNAQESCPLSENENKNKDSSPNQHSSEHIKNFVSKEDPLEESVILADAFFSIKTNKDRMKCFKCLKTIMERFGFCK